MPLELFENIQVSLKTFKGNEKRGSIGSVSDPANGIHFVSWEDNAIVATFLTANPIKSVSRFSRAQRSQITAPQPHLLHQYNQYMGDSIFMMPLYHPVASKFALRNGGGHYSPI